MKRTCKHLISFNDLLEHASARQDTFFGPAFTWTMRLNCKPATAAATSSLKHPNSRPVQTREALRQCPVQCRSQLWLWASFAPALGSSWMAGPYWRHFPPVKGAREAPGCLDKVRTVRQKVLEATAYVTAAAEQGRLLLHLAVL